MTLKQLEARIISLGAFEGKTGMGHSDEYYALLAEMEKRETVKVAKDIKQNYCEDCLAKLSDGCDC